MNHDRPVNLSITAFVFQPKPFRKVVVDLNRAKLPFPADDILDDEINFRTVKGSLSLFF